MLLEGAARGRFPPQDNITVVVGAPTGARAAILSFPAHHIVAADVPEDEVHEQLRADDLNGPLRPAFVALADRPARGLPRGAWTWSSPMRAASPSGS